MSDNNPLRREHFLARNVSRDYTAISERSNDIWAMRVDAGLTASESIALYRATDIAPICTSVTVTRTARRGEMPIWTARCKSGYTFPRKSDSGKVAYMVCKRVCARGELLCAECASAQVVPTDAPSSLLAYVAGILADLCLGQFPHKRRTWRGLVVAIGAILMCAIAMIGRS
jgi:hypothetical protein